MPVENISSSDGIFGMVKRLWSSPIISLITTILLLIIFTLVGAAVFMAIENRDGYQDLSFVEAMFFCTTVYTTIGYGNITPHTSAGKVITVIYACISIPLAVIVLAKLAKLFTAAAKIPWRFVQRYFKSSKDNTSTDHGHVKLPLVVPIAVLLIYILLGALMFTSYEEMMSYSDALYFICISLSSIGFGDICPVNEPFYILSLTYIFIGMAIIATIVNVAIFDVVKDRKEKEQNDLESEQHLNEQQ